MNSDQSSIQANILKLIRKSGGKLSLSDLKKHYEKEYKCVFPLPSCVKLSERVRRFESIKVERNRKNNQMFMLEKKKRAVERSPLPSSSSELNRKERRSEIENQIALLLEENGNRIALSQFSYAYRKKFNKDILTPVGMKLRKWVEQFPSVILEHKANINQTYIVMMGGMKEEEKILSLLRCNDGCVGLSSLAVSYRQKFSQDLLVPVGMKLSHWLCTFYTIALIQKPSNNETYVCLKHPVQIAIDKSSSSKNNPCNKDGTIIDKEESNDDSYGDTSHTASSRNESVFEHNDPLFNFNQQQKEKKAQSSSLSSSLPFGRKSPNPKILLKIEDEADVNVTNMMKIDKKIADDSGNKSTPPSLQPTLILSNTTSKSSKDKNDLSSLSVHSNTQDRDELSKLINEAVEKVANRVSAFGIVDPQDDAVTNNDEDEQNHDEKRSQPSPTLLHSPLTTTRTPQFVHGESEWSMMEEDQKEIMIAEAMHLLGLSLSNGNNSC